jgi:hypothetical protein
LAKTVPSNRLQAFVDTGRVRLEDEEEMIGEGKAEKHKLDDLAYFVENDYTYHMHKTIATGH